MFGWLKSLLGFPGNLHRGIDFLEQYSYDDALESLKAAQDSGDDSDLLHQSMARAFLGKGKCDEALRHAKIAALKKPSNPANQAVLASCFYRSGDFDGAMTALDEGLRTDSKNAYLHYLKGLIWLEKRDPDRALGHFGEFIAFNQTVTLSRLFVMAEHYLASAGPLCSASSVQKIASEKKSDLKNGENGEMTSLPGGASACLGKKSASLYEDGIRALEAGDGEKATASFEILAERDKDFVLARLLCAGEVYLASHFQQAPPDRRL
ncbi:MAG: hypothetical protein CVV64_05195 [Candidatus Wallbacteria bacterium HGW-Wallbacteria-1]|jgi:predicted negative regulator of RcsB-dependent stress response|uniref:Uncharacterized protein n=1 Tax=Candidatus Wallbacteria bacterium HGW-Wallbacteria-1 TaxID=2013854 RepID=A0A2N1PS56_9BACT|nr:MAG: hypothetical protein CVV64_05195 [Candidatus Wallbacteria bacterium HGW-Wallbacteria-1]